MYAAQIRTLCLESHKLLMKQLENLNALEDDSSEILIDSIKLEDYSIQIIEDSSLCADIEDTSQVEASDECVEYLVVVQEEEHVDVVTLDTSQSESLRHQKLNSSHEVCEMCGKTYSKHYIATHLRTHKDNEKAKFKCELVAKVTLTTTFPFIHIIAGDLCGLEFILKCYLYSHMINVHATAKQWNCNVCGKSYGKVRIHIT